MSTPMQQQYKDLKGRYSDCLLLFRLGDFYEGLDEDAKTLAKVLGITLTGRGKDDKRQAMAGFPHHALKQYLPKLINAGLKIAIAEQLEEPKPGKLVERDVIKVITAGTLTDENTLDESRNNYLASIFVLKQKSKFLWGLSIADLTTAEFYVFEILDATDRLVPREILNHLKIKKPNEILVSEKYKGLFKQAFDNISISTFDEDYASLESASVCLNKQFGTSNLKGFGVDSLNSGIIAASEILNYLKSTQKTELQHFKSIRAYNLLDFMQLDNSTIINLELFGSNGRNTHCFYDILNKCQTPMGQRLLRQWILQPLINKDLIEARLDATEFFVKNSEELSKVRDFLFNIYDLERILAKIGLSSVNARDLKSLQSSLESILEINNLKLNFYRVELLDKLNLHISNTSEIAFIIDLINNSISEDPAVTITEGNIIKQGYSAELDELHGFGHDGKSKLIEIQQREVEATGISNLKVKFNSVFGYYIEITKSNLSRVPESYIRKQTLANAERYITEELKLLEEKILGANEKIVKLEYEIFCKIRDQIAEYIPQLLELSKAIAQLDVLSNFAYLAKEHTYFKPNINVSNKLEMKASRHPVIERLSSGEFIPNDIYLDEDQKIIILTGPNMAGKSTYIRQVALNCLMAQIGSFVAADSGNLPVLDRIFTRVGASDNLSQGESTFMVEMNETANILNNATKNSLIILDEVGRGTSTYDGVSIAWSITEYIHEKIDAFTLFATHYHELTELSKQYPKVVNYKVDVKENEGSVVFMRKIVEGGADKSYGIHVAKLAGIPEAVIKRSSEILSKLEESRGKNSKGNLKNAKPQVQLSFVDFEKNEEINLHNEALKEELLQLDINNLTPLEALKKLEELKELINES